VWGGRPPALFRRASDSRRRNCRLASATEEAWRPASNGSRRVGMAKVIVWIQQEPVDDGVGSAAEGPQAARTPSR